MQHACSPRGRAPHAPRETPRANHTRFFVEPDQRLNPTVSCPVGSRHAGDTAGPGGFQRRFCHAALAALRRRTPRRRNHAFSRTACSACFGAGPPGRWARAAALGPTTTLCGGARSLRCPFRRRAEREAGHSSSGSCSSETEAVVEERTRRITYAAGTAGGCPRPQQQQRTQPRSCCIEGQHHPERSRAGALFKGEGKARTQARAGGGARGFVDLGRRTSPARPPLPLSPSCMNSC